MVFIVDDGSVFEAPLDKVWKLVEAHNTDGPKIHPEMKNITQEEVSKNAVIIGWESDIQDRRVKSKMKITAYPPLGMTFELLEGPMTGSKFFNYYTPKGATTGVTVAGDFNSPVMTGDQLKQAVLAFLEQSFNEDSAYLATMR